jgi:hypothetical protein
VLIEGPPREVFARVDVLRSSNISPPPVCQLALSLGLRPLPITVAETSAAILERLAR